jgi:hypothetical protein
MSKTATLPHIRTEISNVLSVSGKKKSDGTRLGI